ncbi:S-methyl-5-thioribose-1-phosphate isomerase [Alicyclobacillus acidoterrestris]|uniref:S-methyl-5-thioribose-1-phosphate isomerase n=1 Tax=Alicyclobacillus suci TaxID=2816080 RepID=UPI0011944C16|nr:S-methyl-5-thioribose-1-phosphate isomerase [Alicyclobacillus suci]GEO27107.1 S-methyl-5-thioribose-1-phosphate isomerase [Alicyclobacillus acidoterrestris]
MQAIRWRPDALDLLDQTKLPQEEIWHTYRTAHDVAQAIRDMKVRGAPAIGTAGAFAVAIEAHRLQDSGNLREQLLEAIAHLRQARPTAVNLNWAMDRMEAVIAATDDDAQLAQALYGKALQIAQDDLRVNRAIGDAGAALFETGVRILTHCNTGSLATTGYGTALGVIRSLHANGQLTHVYADETRPYLQGARLTAYELLHESIPFDIVTDSMAGHLMQQQMVDAVVVGADRIAKNGDTANKIGTYALAVLARYHGIPFYVAAPTSTIDLATTSGADIPIEQRSAREVTEIFGQPIAPVGATALHPAFDVTPGELVTGIITEFGVVRAPYEKSLPALLKEAF